MGARQGAIVLAAGRGRRFRGATPKLLVEVRGRPVISWALESACDAGLDGTAVVVGAADLAPALPAGVVVLANPAWAGGQATSLQVAITWAEAEGLDAIVVGLADQPFVGAPAWRAVAAAEAPIAVATYDGRRRNPVRLAREMWPLLPTTGDEGARAIFGRPGARVTEVPCSGDPRDVDTVDALDAWA